MNLRLLGCRTALTVWPGDDHGHDGGLAGAGGQLESDSQQLRVGFLVHAGQPVQDPPAVSAHSGSNFGEPDESFHSLDLAEERAKIAEVVLPPMQEQPGRLRRDAPVVGAGDVPPLVNTPPDLVHGGGNIVLLLLG